MKTLSDAEQIRLIAEMDVSRAPVSPEAYTAWLEKALLSSTREKGQLQIALARLARIVEQDTS